VGQAKTKEVTLIITACNRPDLLERTLKSFFDHLDFVLSDSIVYEDSGKIGVNNKVKKLFPQVRFIEPGKRTGQIVAQDTLLSEVKTPYVLTWEEDWHTYKSGFFEKALNILEAEPKTLQVLFRHPMDNNGHPTVAGGVYHRYLSTSYHWKGFSFSPSLKRISDYKLIGSYGKHTTFDPANPGASEQALGILYWQMGYRAAILKEGYVRHIGAMRHVKQKL
jgi:GT2 family glycosyltransferase